MLDQIRRADVVRWRGRESWVYENIKKTMIYPFTRGIKDSLMISMIKKCKECECEFPLSNFYAQRPNPRPIVGHYQARCKACHNKAIWKKKKESGDPYKYTRKWKDENKEYTKAYAKEYAKTYKRKTKLNANVEIMKAYRADATRSAKFDESRHWGNHAEVNRHNGRRHYEANKELMRERDRARYQDRKEYLKKWSIDNKESINEKRRAYLKVSRNTPEGKMMRAIRNGLARVLMITGAEKLNTSLESIGCTPQYLRDHIERQFNKRMTWANMGKVWHVDHIRPLASFKGCDDAYVNKAANHYSNLQPMMAKKNLSKGDSWDGQEDFTHDLS